MAGHNVLDHLKELSVDEVKAYCERRHVPASVAMMHVNGDFNFSQIVRTANFFGFRDVHYWGKKKWDRRGAVGTQNYTDIVHHETVDSLLKHMDENGITPIGLENNVEGYHPNSVFNTEWIGYDNVMIIVGEESNGLNKDVLDYCIEYGQLITIEGNGSVRSLNVATAFGIAAAFYVGGY